ncbi:hypothetical protein DL765_006135 [Monosporascus sp. GIB2]|nr:hypothetical protein DL765_006135 [Monosporascus sp. GIB2]
MDAVPGSLTWIHIAGTIALLFPSLAIYRLFFHPLAKFPGPRLAAITRYVEAYYDVVCGGQYTFKIAEMHKKYGPIVRISPYELHVNDPTFFEKLYNREGRWNKYDWAYDAHGTPLSTLSSIDHNVHKQRRAAMNPFFSKANVINRQSIVQRLVSKLCHRLDDFATNSKMSHIKLSAALGALTRDVATEFLLGKSFDNLDADDFRAGVGNTLQESGAIWRTTKHLRWFGSMIKAVPLSLVRKMGDPGMIECLGFVEDMAKTTEALRSESTSGKTIQNSPPTVVGAIMDSDLPPTEKTAERLTDEVITVAGAAFETTAYTLSVTVYNVYSNPRILQRLRAELLSAGLNKREPNLAELEKLPYLTAVLSEGLRFSPALATRMARVAPDRDLVYGKQRIPAGTPVGMTALLMHLDPEVYPDPMRFDPDRWMDAEARKRIDKAYAPFGRGTRICIGMHLAWVELYMVVAAIVQRFDFEFDADAAKDVTWVSDMFTIGTAARNGLKAVITRH